MTCGVKGGEYTPTISVPIDGILATACAMPCCDAGRFGRRSGERNAELKRNLRRGLAYNAQLPRRAAAHSWCTQPS
jgi:hypothetical protein